MKKSLLFGIISLGIGIATSDGQTYRYVSLDNYNSGTALPIVYGYGMPANGVSGAFGTPGVGLSSAWTVGLYWAAGTTGLSQPAGFGLPDPSLTLGTGIGSTVAIGTQNAYGSPGYYSSILEWNCGSSSMITLEVVVYPTAAGSYANALYRIHSAAFSMPTVGATSPFISATGDFMPGQLFMSPEPGTLALGGLAGLSLWLFSRKKA